MADRKKVINGLKHCRNRSFCNDGCPYNYIMMDPSFGIDECTSQLAQDALELLKDQEPIEPKRTVDEHGQALSCGNCGAWFEIQFQKYCHECGRKVKWDETD